MIARLVAGLTDGHRGNLRTGDAERHAHPDPAGAMRFTALSTPSGDR
jgi:hypothetical protein